MRQISSPVGGVFRKMGSCFGSPNSKNKGVSIQIPSKNRQNQWFSIIFKFRGPTFGPEISTFTSGKPRLTLRFGSPSKVNCLVRPRVKSRGRPASELPQPRPTPASVWGSLSSGFLFLFQSAKWKWSGGQSAISIYSLTLVTVNWWANWIEVWRVKSRERNVPVGRTVTR